MIALNELLNNLDKYSQKYQQIGFKANLDKIKKLENNRKEVQLLSEDLRAKCNKQASEIATIKLQGKNFKKELNAVLALDKKINKLNKKLENQGKAINKQLKKLRNLPETVIAENQDISCAKNPKSIDEFTDLIFEKKGYKIFSSNNTTNSYIKDVRGRLFEENALPCLTKCADGIICFFTDFDLQTEFEAILNTLKLCASKITRIKSSNTAISSADEYVAALADGDINLELIKEFNTREFSIKYKNSKIDMTKFVNQINIIIKRWGFTHIFYCFDYLLQELF